MISNQSAVHPGFIASIVYQYLWVTGKYAITYVDFLLLELILHSGITLPRQWIHSLALHITHYMYCIPGVCGNGQMELKFIRGGWSRLLIISCPVAVDNSVHCTSTHTRPYRWVSKNNTLPMVCDNLTHIQGQSVGRVVVKNRLSGGWPTTTDQCGQNTDSHSVTSIVQPFTLCTIFRVKEKWQFNIVLQQHEWSETSWYLPLV